MSTMPVRCFDCNKVVGNKWYPYKDLLSQGMTEKEALDELQLKRFCCRRMLLTHVELEDLLIAYSETSGSSRTKPKLGADSRGLEARRIIEEED